MKCKSIFVVACAMAAGVVLADEFKVGFTKFGDVEATLSQLEEWSEQGNNARYSEDDLKKVGDSMKANWNMIRGLFEQVSNDPNANEKLKHAAEVFAADFGNMTTKEIDKKDSKELASQMTGKIDDLSVLFKEMQTKTQTLTLELI